MDTEESVDGPKYGSGTIIHEVFRSHTCKPPDPYDVARDGYGPGTLWKCSCGIRLKLMEEFDPIRNNRRIYWISIGSSGIGSKGIMHD